MLAGDIFERLEDHHCQLFHLDTQCRTHEPVSCQSDSCTMVKRFSDCYLTEPGLQVARLQREERLGALQIELASGKVLRLTQLRGFARVVRSIHCPALHQLHAPYKRCLQFTFYWGRASLQQPTTPY